MPRIQKRQQPLTKQREYLQQEGQECEYKRDFKPCEAKATGRFSIHISPASSGHIRDAGQALRSKRHFTVTKLNFNRRLHEPLSIR